MEPSPEKEPLPDPIERWIASQNGDRTKLSYRTTVKQWLTHVNGDYLGVKDNSALDGWRARLLNEGNRDRTVARKIATVSSLYTYLERHKIIGEAVHMEWVSRPKPGSSGETPGLSLPEVRAVLKAAAAAGPRTHVAVQVMLSTAIRSRELLDLDVSTFRTKTVTKTDKTTDRVLTVRVRRKGGKRSEVVLPDRVAHDVDALRGARKTGPLLTNSLGGPWSYKALNVALEAVGKAAGVEGKLTPHMLRVTWCTEALGAGIPLQDVQDVMGHASPETTRMYDRGQDALNRKSAAVNRVFEAFSG